MLFSAVSLFLSLANSGIQQQAALEDPAWTRIKSSVATIGTQGNPSGMAVLIDGQGFFLAHKSAFLGDQTVATLSNGSMVNLTLTATDDVTQLALLKAENWINSGQMVVRVSGSTTSGTKLIAATISGPIRGELVSDKKVGQIRPTLRYTPLSEIRLESNLAKVGGAMVFDEQGSLVGVLGATLSSNTEQSSRAFSGGFAKGKAVEKPQADLSNYGPQGLTVAYSLGPMVIKRVVDGLLKPDHKVQHPSVGLFFKSAPEPGALIEAVLAGTPASGAGIQVGDIVTAVDGLAIKNQVDFAIQLFNHNVGDRITITLKRADQELTVTLVVGAQDSFD